MPWKQLIRTRDNPLSVPPQAREYRSFFRPFEARGPGPGLASSLISCSFWTMAPSLLPNCPKRLGKLPQSLSS